MIPVWWRSARARRRRSPQRTKGSNSSRKRTGFPSTLQTATATDPPIVLSGTPPSCPAPGLPHVPVITTPDGQTIDLGARQEGEHVFVGAFIEPATGMDTGYRVYVRGEETYLALFRQDVLAYLARVQWTAHAVHRRIGRGNPKKRSQRTAVPLCAGFFRGTPLPGGRGL